MRENFLEIILWIFLTFEILQRNVFKMFIERSEEIDKMVFFVFEVLQKSLE